MFKKILKWCGIVIGGLMVIAAVLVAGAYALGSGRLTKKYDVQAEAVSVPTDAASIEQGKHWALSYCTHCHAEDLSGKPLVDDATIGYIPAPNLTGGEGGAGGEFTDADWVRAIRHGVDPEGRALIGMPSMNYYYMSDKDLGEMIAYIKSAPPVDHEMGEPAMSSMGKTLLGAGAFGPDILPAEVIQHGSVRPTAVVTAMSSDYGGYLVRLGGCRDCHGKDLRGGHSPEPGAPQAPDLTANGIFHQWSEQTFITAVRTMNGKGMPWEELRPMTDSELKAVFMYLQALPER